MTISDEKKQKIAKANNANPYVDIIPYELEISFPIIKYEGFHPKKEEFLVYVAPAVTFKDKEKIVGYQGNNGGVSIHVTKGISVRTGGSKSSPILTTVRQSNFGDLLITNKRIIFIGKDDSFEFNIDKISTIKLLDKNSFIIQSGRSFKNLWLDSDIISYAYSFINYVIKQNSEGVDLYSSIINKKKNLSSEQIELCNQIRLECSKVKLKNDKEENPWKSVKVLWSIVLIFFACVIILISVTNKITDKKNDASNLLERYTLEDVLNLENSPNLFDSYENTKTYFNKVENIKVLTIPEHSQINRNLKKITEDENLIYFIQHSTHEDYVGTVQINVFSENNYSGMNVEKAIKILTSFLPKDFFKYYSKDVSYKHSDNNCTVYTYACRMNDNGINFKNNGHFEYPAYYSFYIIHFETTNQWKLQTDYSAYGDKGLEWINKYSDKWNVDYKDYID